MTTCSGYTPGQTWMVVSPGLAAFTAAWMVSKCGYHGTHDAGPTTKSMAKTRPADASVKTIAITREPKNLLDMCAAPQSSFEIRLVVVSRERGGAEPRLSKTVAMRMSSSRSPSLLHLSYDAIDRLVWKSA